MDKQNARLRINLSTREIEVEGSEEFVREYMDRFEDLLHSFTDLPELEPVSEQEQVAGRVDIETPTGETPEVFGEYLNQFPKNISDYDKVLAAAYYAQTQNPEKLFTTREANKLLQSQGIKVANASEAIRHHKRTKRAFSVSRGKYRVSQPGVDYLDSLVYE